MYRATFFLASELVGGEWSASGPCRFTPRERTPGTHWIGGWVNTRAGLDDAEKRKFLTVPGLELRPLGRPTRSQSLYRLRYPVLRCDNVLRDGCRVSQPQTGTSSWSSTCKRFQIQKPSLRSQPRGLGEGHVAPRTLPPRTALALSGNWTDEDDLRMWTGFIWLRMGLGGDI
jgi:hypothetical protein